ncbi:MAG: hypothetical protein M0024_07190 [Nitrospiraceae bacterium]|nr:hypothetical protein [Nitrospiraceae bacterium]
MKKRIAVLVRKRQAEALRMAIGLTLADDEVTVFIMNIPLSDDAAITMNLEMLGEVGVRILSNKQDAGQEKGFEQLTTEEIAGRLTEFDTVIPY